MSPQRRASYIGALSGLLVTLAAALPSSASALPTLLTQLGRSSEFQVRPAQVVYTGDVSGVLGGFSGRGTLKRFGRLHWSTWTSRDAAGQGAVWVDDCEPDCADGTFSPYAVKVHAFDPSRGHFTRLTLLYELEGKAVVDRRGVRKFGSDYAYYIVGH